MKLATSLTRRALASAAATKPSAAAAISKRCAFFTTYSGGQPSEGQGGFYGSAKTRSENPTFTPGSRVEEPDLAKLTKLMAEWEATSTTSENAWGSFVSKHVDDEFIKRLVVKGSPVWGLSLAQREFVSRFQL